MKVLVVPKLEQPVQGQLAAVQAAGQPRPQAPVDFAAQLAGGVA